MASSVLALKTRTGVTDCTWDAGGAGTIAVSVISSSPLLLLLAALERSAKTVQSLLPHSAVAIHPLVQLAEGPGRQLVETPAPLGAHQHEVGVLEDGQLPGDARLTNVDHLDQLGDRPLAVTQRLDDAPPGWVGQDLEGVGHGYILREQHMSCQQH